MIGKVYDARARLRPSSASTPSLSVVQDASAQPVKSDQVAQLSPRNVLLTLLLLNIGFAVASYAGDILMHFLGTPRRVRVFVELMHVDLEANFPTWYTSAVMLISALLLGVIAAYERRGGSRWWKHWVALSVIFVLLSAEEVGGLHEQSIIPMRTALNNTGVAAISATGIFHFAWVVPAAVAVVIVGLIYLRFVLSLPTHTRWLVMAAGAMYVGGALGMEMVDGWHASTYGEDTLLSSLIPITEEFLEMTGLAVFVYALLRYIGEQVGEVRVGTSLGKR
jgi:hypothetical protein